MHKFLKNAKKKKRRARRRNNTQLQIQEVKDEQYTPQRYYCMYRAKCLNSKSKKKKVITTGWRRQGTNLSNFNQQPDKWVLFFNEFPLNSLTFSSICRIQFYIHKIPISKKEHKGNSSKIQDRIQGWSCKKSLMTPIELRT